MRYGRVSVDNNIMDGDYELIIIEDNKGGHKFYSKDSEEVEELKELRSRLMEENGRVRIEDLIGSGYSYYFKELGAYVAGDKKRIDKIIRDIRISNFANGTDYTG